MDGTSILDEAPAEGQRIENPAGYVLLAIYRIDSCKAWGICPGGMYVPYNQNLAFMAKSDPNIFETKNKKEILKLSGVKIQSNPMHTALIPVVAFPELFNAGYNEKDWNRTNQRIGHDVGEESRMIIELTMALSCANVSLATDTPSKLLQKQRKAKKKPSLFDYHVLVINGQEIGANDSGPTGTHASPRTHLRRGHLRRLPHREERIWINDTIVNPGNGFVQKDYAVHS